MSETDSGERQSLTGAIGRLLFLDIAGAEVARAKRYQSSLSGLLIDVVYSKPVDDANGLAAEDLVLQHFLSVCRSTLRAPDYIGRIGGEEFAIMLPETLLLNALGVAERILENLAASTADASQRHLSATASIGAVEYADQMGSLDRLLQAARVAMHDAKQNGRNQAVCYLDDVQLMSNPAAIN